MSVSEKDALEELNNICQNYPVYAGKTISHAGARECSDRGWVKRNTEGDWVPTTKGWQMFAAQGTK